MHFSVKNLKFSENIEGIRLRPEPPWLRPEPEPVAPAPEPEPGSGASLIKTLLYIRDGTELDFQLSLNRNWDFNSDRNWAKF